VTAVSAYRAVAPRLGTLVVALVIVVVVEVVLGLTAALIPVAVFLLVRWSLLGAVVGAEGADAPLGVLRRSAALARGNWWRTASILLVVAAALLAGPAVGVLVLLFTGAAFDLVNLIAALVYTAALPFAAVAMSYLYFDLRERGAAEAAGHPVAAGALPSS
jgi:hypothetical protein